MPQPVTEPATRDAIFLVLTVNSGDESRDAVRAACGEHIRAERMDLCFELALQIR